MVAGLSSGEGGEHGGDVRSDEEAPVQSVAHEAAAAAAAAAATEAATEEEAVARPDEEAPVQQMGPSAAAGAVAAAAAAAAKVVGPKRGSGEATVGAGEATGEVSETELRAETELRLVLRAAAVAVREISERDATVDSRGATVDSASDAVSGPRGGCEDEDEDELRRKRSRDVALVVWPASAPAGRLAERAGPRMSLRRRGGRPSLGRRGSPAPPRLSTTDLRMSEAVPLKEAPRLLSECLTVRSVMGDGTSGRDERRLRGPGDSATVSDAGDEVGGGAART